MKIALSLSGQSRCGMFCFPYIYDAFLNDFKVDTFIHTWKDYRVLNLYNPTACLVEDNPEEIAQYLLHQLTIAPQTVMDGNPYNNLLGYYSIKRSFDLIPDDYDYIIRCRFDVIIQQKFNLKKILTDLQNNLYDVFIPDSVFNFGGYQDRIAIGTYKAMKVYSDTVTNMNNMAIELGRWHPETFLGVQLDTNSIRVYQQDIDHRLVRDVSIATNWPENPYPFLNL